MLRQLMWVLGLGTIGLAFFGPLGGQILGAIGFAIGSFAKPSANGSAPSPPLIRSERADEPPESTYVMSAVEPASRTSTVTRLIWLAIAACAMLSLPIVGILQSRVNLPADPGLRQPTTPGQRPVLVPSTQTWSSSECLERNFGLAVAKGLAVPPEVRIFCAYPWNTQALRALSITLASMQLTPKRMLDEIRPPPAQLNLLQDLVEASRSMQMPDGLLEIYELTKVLPLVWAASPQRAAHRSLLRHNFNKRFEQQLAKASAVVDWNTQLTKRSMIRQFGLSDEVTLYTDQATDLTTEDLATLIVGAYDKRLDGLEVNPLTDSLRRLQGVAVHAKHAQSFMFLEMYTMMLDVVANRLRTDEGLTAFWRPADHPQRTSRRPLEIYVLEASVKDWCRGADMGTHGQYCPNEDRILVLQPGESSGTTNSRDFPLGVSAPLLHEIAHSYLNPENATEQPFVTEGVVTAFGERMLRATAAAVPAAHDLTPAQSAKFVSLLFAPPNEQSEGASPAEASNFDPIKFANLHIRRAPPTGYAKRALCAVAVKPMTPDYVKAFASMTSVTFRGQAEPELRRAYAYSWAIFNYGLDASRIGLGGEGSQFDASPVQRVSQEFAANRRIEPELDAQLSRLLSGVNSRVREEIAKRRMSCPK